ncbi:TetR family transcriptional regulator [Actinoplanes aureus]|jgi:AcrR family transcriptional regulator|uniref:TetR family transcriptional regulator n=1 Tax=Actinoplanes aureus TaxID=2792083 RepID=A0A931CN72_9ACTN|nr:TetR family transcriptional regulator [Actinoplanes aureus]MBG0567985.1 TetR family transcriptional regulator [Actinoplanes aureus]
MTLWSRTRTAVYGEITRTAMELFLERGFEATTIDDIAAAAGISRRSFFRYFGTKEDVVLGDLVARGELIRDAFEARPESEDPWTALLGALHSVKDAADETDAEMLKVFKMVHQTPSLRARSIEKHLQWQALLTPEVRRRLGADPADPFDVRAEALVATVLTCLDVAGEAWARGDGAVPLEGLFDAAAAAVRG